MKYTLESSREWYNNLPGKRASAAMIIRWQRKYLLIKDDYKAVMNFPSGVIDPDESPMQTAIRETGEEVGIRLAPEKVSFFSVSYIAENNGFKDRFHFYFITDVDDETAGSIALEDGIEYYKWLGVDEIAEMSGEWQAYDKLAGMLESGTAVPYFEA